MSSPSPRGRGQGEGERIGSVDAIRFLPMPYHTTLPKEANERCIAPTL